MWDEEKAPVCASKTDPLPVFSLWYGYEMLQGERRPWNRPDEIRNQSGFHLSLMVLPLVLAPSPSTPPGRSSAPVRRLSPLPVGISHIHPFASTRTSPAQMYGLVTVRRVQNGFIRPGIPFPTNLTRRTAHSGLLDSICGDYQRGLITFNSRPFPSKNPQLWSFVRTRDRYQRRPFRLALTRKVPCFLLPSPPPFSLSPSYTSFVGKYPNPSPFSPSGTHMAPHNWSSTVTRRMPKNWPPCQLFHPNPSS